MSAATIHDLLNNLEQTIHERFRVITQLLSSQMKAPEPPIMGELLMRIQALEKRLQEPKQELLPTSPMVGLEIFRKQAPAEEKLVVITPSAPPVTPVVTVETEVELDMDNASVIDAEAEAEAEAEEELEEEASELEEFEYKGATYYRDSDNNVYTTDEDGELNEEPFGLWNEAKQRIVARP